MRYSGDPDVRPCGTPPVRARCDNNGALQRLHCRSALHARKHAPWRFAMGHGCRSSRSTAYSQSPWLHTPEVLVRIAVRSSLAANAVLRCGKNVTMGLDRKSTRLNSSHQIISYAVFCLKKKKQIEDVHTSHS